MTVDCRCLIDWLLKTGCFAWTSGLSVVFFAAVPGAGYFGSRAGHPYFAYLQGKIAYLADSVCT